MATVRENWASQQLIDAATLTRTLTNPVQALTKPPFFRATEMTNTTFDHLEKKITWQNVDIHGGWASPDKTTFTTSVGGIFWVNCMIAAQTPFTSRSTRNGGVMVKVKTGALYSPKLILKSVNTTRVRGDYQSVQTSGLIYLSAGESIVALAQVETGAWGKARSNHPAKALSMFSALLVTPDATQL